MDGLTANDTGLDYRQRAGHDGRDKFAGRKYLKEATIILNVENVNEVRAADIIKAVVDKCGHGKILALRPRQGKEYELTMENEETCEDLMDGLNIKGVNCEIKRLQNRDYVVSFMHLPVYLEDREIIEKLEGWGVDPISKIKRRCYPGTEIEDGTRFLKVRFPKEVASLPYSTRLETAEGQQYFRVMHSHQVKTCRLCMSPDHLLKECPDFKCHKCGERGHFARDCNAARCPECQKILNKCVCMEEEEEGGRELQVDGQVHEGNNEEERQTDVVQEEQVMQQKEMEEGTSNREEEGEQENNKDKEQTMEQDMQWSAMGTSDSGKRYRDEMEKKEIKMDNTENNREVRGQIRRRSSKFEPNLENARKKTTIRSRDGSTNRYDVLKDLEGENGD